MKPVTQQTKFPNQYFCINLFANFTYNTYKSQNKDSIRFFWAKTFDDSFEQRKQKQPINTVTQCPLQG